jgi:hypothetical protein
MLVIPTTARMQSNTWAIAMNTALVIMVGWAYLQLPCLALPCQHSGVPIPPSMMTPPLPTPKGAKPPPPPTARDLTAHLPEPERSEAMARIRWEMCGQGRLSKKLQEVEHDQLCTACCLCDACSCLEMHVLM